MPNANEQVVRKPNIHLNLFSCKEVYRPEEPFSGLKIQDDVEVCLIVAGKGVYCVVDQVIPCNAGEIYITPAETPHRFFRADENEPLTIRQLRFRVDEWLEGDVSNPESPRYCYGVFLDGAVTSYALLNDRMREKVGFLFDDMESELDGQKAEWVNAIRFDLSQLLLYVGRYINCSIKNVPSASSTESNMVLTAIHMVKEQYGNPDLTLDPIAKLFSVSKSQISKLFKKLTGTLFSDYLRNVRLDEACRLLKDSSATVEEIVFACGLRDLPSFYKNFKLYKNQTPLEYRQSVRQTGSGADKAKNILGDKLMSTLNEISENLQKGKAKLVKELVQQALDEGAKPSDILDHGLLAGMNEIGEKFKNNEVYVPEVLVAARAMNMGTQVLKPYLASEGIAAKGKVCIGTVQGDLHDIGKNLVKMMMEGKGLEVVDLGTDVSAETFVQTAIEQDCQVICCSALLTTTMEVMAEVVRQAEKAGIRDKVKIMIGGAPISQEFCDLIHADCYTPDAASAADAAVAFCEKK